MDFTNGQSGFGPNTSATTCLLLLLVWCYHLHPAIACMMLPIVSVTTSFLLLKREPNYREIHSMAATFTSYMVIERYTKPQFERVENRVQMVNFTEGFGFFNSLSSTSKKCAL